MRSRKITAITTGAIATILVFMEVPIRLLEHYHLLVYVKEHAPFIYAALVSVESAVVRWVVGVLMILWLILEYRKAGHVADEQPIEKAVAAATNSTPLINFAPVLQQTQTVGHTENLRNRKAIDGQNKPRELRFNFTSSDVYGIHVIEERDGFSVIAMPQFYRGFMRLQPAVVIEITNRAHKDFNVDFASGVLAELIVDSTPIGPLLWLDNNKAEIDFHAGHPNTLLLGVGESQYSDRWVIPRRIVRNTENGYRVVNSDYAIPAGIEPEIKVGLSAKGKIIYEIPLIWKWSDGKPIVTLKAG